MIHRKSFYSGMAISFALIATLLIGWIGLHFHRIMPVVNANPKAKNYTAPKNKDIHQAVTSLERLYHLTKFFGMDTYSAKAIGAAGKALSLKTDEASKLQAKYFYLKSIEEAQKVAASKSGNTTVIQKVDPLLDAYLNYSLFLNDSGHKTQARQTLRRAKKMVEQKEMPKDLQSHKIEDINNALHKMNLKKI